MLIRVLVFCIFIAVLVVLVAALINLLRGKAKGTIDELKERKGMEGLLKQFPPAFEIWEKINKTLKHIEVITHKCKTDAPVADWAELTNYENSIVSLLTKIKGYIEANPQDSIRISGIQDQLPAIRSLFSDYVSNIMYSTDGPNAKVNHALIQEGLLGYEKILNGYIELLFEEKTFDIHENIEALLNKESTGQHCK